ncbi:MAG: hypothetical protein V4615_07175 [Bacteroidota bacterium]
MTAIRFALISLMFLWGVNVHSQETLSKEELELKRRLKLTLLTYNNTALYSSRSDLPTVLPDMYEENLLEFSLKDVSTDDFALHVDESFFDSTISYYNTANFIKMLSRNVEFSNPYELEGLENYYKLFSKIYGNIQNAVPIKREILSLRDRKFKLAFLTYHVSFKGAAGELCVSINTTKKGKPSFWFMQFTAFDYNQVPFFLTIASLPFEHIKTKNITALKKNVSKMFFWINDKSISKDFKSLNCDSTQLFKSHLIYKYMGGKARTFADVIYDMPKEEKYLRLEFISEDNKFKLNHLGFIDKERK